MSDEKKSESVMDALKNMFKEMGENTPPEKPLVSSVLSDAEQPDNFQGVVFLNTDSEMEDYAKRCGFDSLSNMLDELRLEKEELKGTWVPVDYEMEPHGVLKPYAEGVFIFFHGEGSKEHPINGYRVYEQKVHILVDDAGKYFCNENEMY